MSFKTLGILNQDYQPGDDNYGIPYPGTIIVDRNGVVVGKLFLESYRERVDARSVYKLAMKLLTVEGEPAPGESIKL